jgi:hypothetical protein
MERFGDQVRAVWGRSGGFAKTLIVMAGLFVGSLPTPRLTHCAPLGGSTHRTRQRIHKCRYRLVPAALFGRHPSSSPYVRGSPLHMCVWWLWFDLQLQLQSF